MKKMLQMCRLCLSGLFLLAFFGLAGSSEEVRAEEVSLVQGESVQYMGYSTHYYYVNGGLAYCLEPDKLSPGSGGYPAESLDQNQLLSKAMYYVYGGPGFEEYIKPTLTGGWEQPDRSYCLSHCILSFVYDGCDPNSAAFIGLNEDIKNAVIGYTEAIQSWPGIPDTDIRFSKNKVQAVFARDEKVQKTESVDCIGDARNTVTLPLPEGVTLVNESKGTKETGNVPVHGGERFHLEADVAYGNGTAYDSGPVYGAIKEAWRTLVIKTGGGSQDIGAGQLVTVETAPVSIAADWIPAPELTIDKRADKESKKYKVGDIITYTADVTQQIAAAVAKNVVISDTIITEGVKLQKNSVILLDGSGARVKDAVIDVKGNTYTIHGGETMEFLQSVETGEKFTVEYQVAITDESVIGKEIENEIIVRADNAEEKKDKEIVEVPEEPKEVPETPKTPKPEQPKPEEPKPEVQPAPVVKAGVVKTGDSQNLTVIILLLILSCTLIFTCGRISRKTK